MTHPDFKFKIKDNVQVRVDFAHKRAVILAETENKKLLQLEVAYKIINKIHDEIRDQTVKF